MEVCEDAYRSLLRLVPDLRRARGCLGSTPVAAADLYLEVLEQSRYTTLLRLTHAFPCGEGVLVPSLDPNARLCAYHDARQVEVLDLYQTALPIYRHYDYPALEAKWRANQFLAKWLAFCARQGHRFGPGALEAGPGPMRGCRERHPDLSGI
jgi:uncharacterized protein